MISSITVEYCGEEYRVLPDATLVIGRQADLVIDDNPFLHRHFLQVRNEDQWWWLSNVGSRLHATVADEHGLMQAWLAPGAQLPIVFSRSIVWFSAGSTTYELSIVLEGDPPFNSLPTGLVASGTSTMGGVTLTPDQRILIVALCEPLLQDATRSVGSIPTSADAASRLGWSLTKFNRKLDNVCDKLTRAGVRGLHGGPDNLAVNRRARLTEYAMASRLVSRDDLSLLPSQSQT